MISIRLNGEAREIAEGLTVATLLDWLKLPRDGVAVERNLEIVPRAQWPETPIQAGDRLEVVHLVGGGACEPAGATFASGRSGYGRSGCGPKAQGINPIIARSHHEP